MCTATVRFVQWLNNGALCNINITAAYNRFRFRYVTNS